MLIGVNARARYVDDIDNPLIRDIINFLNSAQADPAAKTCPHCGFDLEYRNWKFIYREETWTIPLPVCAQCYSGSTGRTLV